MSVYVRNKKYFIISFILPVTVILGVYAVAGMYPFGNISILANDLSGQYIEILQYFRKLILLRENLFYSFNSGLGKGIIGVISFVALSPLNIILILFKKENIETAVLVITVIKYGLAGMGMSYCLNYKYKNENIYNSRMIPLFSLCYSLSAFGINYSLNIMWLDSMVLLPVVLGSTVKYIREDRKIGLIVWTFILIMSNFYMSYIVIGFGILYFWYEIFDTEYRDKYSGIEKKFSRFAGFLGLIAVAAMLSAFITYPVYLSLVRENDIRSLLRGDIIYRTGDIFAGLFLGAFHTLKTNGIPNFYSGLVILITVIEYFIDYGTPLRDKIRTFLILFFMYMSTRIKFLYMIWHGLDSPNWFPARFSFTVSFFLILVSCKYYLKRYGARSNFEKSNFKNYKNKKIGITVSVISVLTLSIMFLKKNYISDVDIFINVLLLSVYLIILTMKTGKRKEVLLSVTIITEIFINTFLTQQDLKKDIRYVEKGTYIEERNKIYSNISFIKSVDDGIYRIAKDYDTRYNSSMGIGYMSVDVYYSIYNRNLHKFLNKMGLSFFDKYGKYEGNTVISDSILGIKYIITSDYRKEYILLKETGEYGIYKNNYAFPTAFFVEKGIEEYNNYDSYNNSLELQNDMIKDITGINEDIVKKISPEDKKLVNVKISENGSTKYEKINKKSEAYIEYTVKKENPDNITYFYINNLDRIIKKISLEINGEDMYNGKYWGVKIFEVGNDYKIRIHFLEDNVEINEDAFYETDLKKFIYMTGKIRSQNIIEEMKPGYIKIKNPGLEKTLMTTIPYEKGWKLKVDGKNKEIGSIDGVFLGTELSENDVLLEFIYETPGLKTGILISLTGVFILLKLVFRNRGKKIIKYTKLKYK